MRHPLETLPPDSRARGFAPLLIATLLITFAFRFIGPASPNIVDYELAGSVDRAAQIIGAWRETDRIRAGFSLGFDYLYMPVYSTTIALACLWGAAVIRSGWWRLLGLTLAWGLWLAALLDATENLALIVMLLGAPSDPYPAVAAVCAALKFGLILLGLLYAAVAAAARVFKRA